MENPLVTDPTPLITDPIGLATFFTVVLAGIFWLAKLESLKGFFKIFPPLIWTYFVPMMGTTLGLTPESSDFYTFMSKTLLPVILVLLLIPTNVKSVFKLGPLAIGIMLIGTLGIVVGAAVSFGIGNAIYDIPEDSWKGIAALAGSWIGGSANMIAIKESIDTPDAILAPLIVVDTVLCYSWLGILIWLASYQGKIDKFNGANNTKVEAINAELLEDYEANKKPLDMKSFALMLGIGFGVGKVCILAGNWGFGMLQENLQETMPKLWNYISVINGFGWGIILVTIISLLLAMTKVRQLDYSGASHVGYYGLYLLLASIGARADLKQIAEVPEFFVIGLIWITIHILILTAGVRIFKAPLFLLATGSMANMGGTASAPVVAAAYQPSMAPVGLLMAIIGSITGTFVGLLIIVPLLRWMAGG